MSLPMPDIFTPEQAAAYLKVNRETIYRYIRDGTLSASRLGRSYRISRRSLEQLLLSTRTRPDIPIRIYSDEELARFLVADQLDREVLEVIRALGQQTADSSAHESN